MGEREVAFDLHHLHGVPLPFPSGCHRGKPSLIHWSHRQAEADGPEDVRLGIALTQRRAGVPLRQGPRAPALAAEVTMGHLGRVEKPRLHAARQVRDAEGRLVRRERPHGHRSDSAGDGDARVRVRPVVVVAPGVNAPIDAPRRLLVLLFVTIRLLLGKREPARRRRSPTFASSAVRSGFGRLPGSAGPSSCSPLRSHRNRRAPAGPPLQGSGLVLPVRFVARELIPVLFQLPPRNNRQPSPADAGTALSERSESNGTAERRLFDQLLSQAPGVAP